MRLAEQKALRFIERYQAENGGASPSLGEIAADLGSVSRSTGHRLLAALERAGLIRRVGPRRAIEIVGLPPALVALTDEALLAEVKRRGLA